MAVSVINQQPQTKRISINESYTLAGTDYEYIGLEITIPAKCDYAVAIRDMYQNTRPNGIRVYDSSTGTGTYNLMAENGNGAYAYMSGYTSNGFTAYVWVRHVSAGTNYCLAQGWYRCQQ